MVQGACLWHRRSRVRIPSLAPKTKTPTVCACSSTDRVLGFGPRGCGFESRRARQHLDTKAPDLELGAFLISNSDPCGPTRLNRESPVPVFGKPRHPRLSGGPEPLSSFNCCGDGCPIPSFPRAPFPRAVALGKPGSSKKFPGFPVRRERPGRSGRVDFLTLRWWFRMRLRCQTMRVGRQGRSSGIIFMARVRE